MVLKRETINNLLYELGPNQTTVKNGFQQVNKSTQFFPYTHQSPENLLDPELQLPIQQSGVFPGERRRLGLLWWISRWTSSLPRSQVEGACEIEAPNQTHTIRSCLPAWGLLFQTELCFVGISWVWPIDLYNMYFYAAKYIAFIPIHACMLKIPSLSRIFRASLQRRLFLGGGQSFFWGHLIHELSFQRAVVKKIL